MIWNNLITSLSGITAVLPELVHKGSVGRAVSSRGKVSVAFAGVAEGRSRAVPGDVSGLSTFEAERKLILVVGWVLAGM